VQEVPVTPSAATADRYVIERELGSGGMATVYRATDLKHSRPVAIKVLRPELALAVGTDRFLHEIGVLATLTHPHIVPLLDSGSRDGLPFYVMPLVEGETLRARLRRDPQLPVAETIRITRDLSEALGYAHARGVIHRDIKPENILLAGDHALLADFGIAHAVTQVARAERLTESGLAVGSPLYMCPEQAHPGSQVDGRADLYGLGCVMYEMLTGAPPFTGSTAQAILARHMCDPAAPIRTVRPTVPPHLEEVILRLLAKTPADRIPSAAALIEALERPAPTPAAAPAIPRPRRVTRLRPVVLLAALASAAAVAGVALLRPTATPTTGADWIMVADFVGPGEDSTLAPAVRELVTVELDQSPSFTTMPRHQVAAALQAGGFPDSARVSPEVARELAERSSVRAVITGSVLPVAGEAYSIVLRAVSVDDGSEIASIAGAADPGELIQVVEDLARRLRRALGERRDLTASPDQPLEQVATPSLDAYRHFVQARDRIDAGDLAGGKRLLHEAIRLDSAFASAWEALGISHVFGRNLDSARIAYARALSFPKRLTETQRFGVEADAAYAIRHDLPAAISWYDLYLSRNPRSAGARNNRALYLSSLGRHEEALEELRRAIEVNPLGPEHAQVELLNLAAELVVLGRVREATAEARKLKGVFADYFSVLRPSALADWALAESTAASIASRQDAPSFLRIQAVTTQAAARAARGAAAHAERLLLAASRRAASEEMRWYHQARLLLATAAQRDLGPPPDSLATDSSAAGRVMHALWAAVQGDTGTAVRALEQAAAMPEETSLLGAGPALARAWVDAHAGRWQAVTDSLGGIAQHGEHDATILDRGTAYPVRLLVADAYERLGRLDSAAAYLELVVTPTRMAPGHFAMRGLVYPFAHRRLAVLYAALGKADASADHSREVARSLTEPDPELRRLLPEP
jgi:serine/threonine-protein kinase